MKNLSSFCAFITSLVILQACSIQHPSDNAVPNHSTSAKSESFKSHKKVQEELISQAVIFINKKNYSDAVESVSEAIKLDDNLSYYRMRAYLYQILGEQWKALNDYQYLIQQEKPILNSTYVNISDVLIKLGMYSKAKTYIQKAISSDSSTMILANRAIVLTSEQKYSEALKDIDIAIAPIKSLRLEHQSPLPLLGDSIIESKALKKELLEKLGKFDEAKEENKEISTILNKRYLIGKRVSTAKKEAKNFDTQFNTKEIQIFSNYPKTKLVQYSKNITQFLNWLNSNYVNQTKPFKPRVFVFDKSDKFLNFYETVLYENKSKAGTACYSCQLDTCIIVGDSNYTSLIHELMHAITYREFILLEPWAVEGIPEVVEQCYIETDNGPKLLVNRAYPCLYQFYKSKKVKERDLTKFLTTSRFFKEQRFEGLLLATFLLKNKKLKKYIRLCQNGHKNGYPTAFEAAFDDHHTALFNEWRKFLLEIGILAKSSKNTLLK